MGFLAPFYAEASPGQLRVRIEVIQGPSREEQDLLEILDLELFGVKTLLLDSCFV